MRKSLCGALLVMLFVTANGRAQQPAIGIFGGINQSSLKGDAPEKTSFGGLSGFAAGAVGEFRIANEVLLSIQPMYLQRGTKIAFEIPGEDQPRDSMDARIDYFTVPVLLKVISGNGKTYVTSGLDFGFLSSAKLIDGAQESDIKEFFKSTDIAVVFGFGAMFPIGNPRLSFELRYSQSLLNISSQSGNPEGTSLPTRFRSSGLQLLAGVLLPLGKK